MFPSMASSGWFCVGACSSKRGDFRRKTVRPMLSDRCPVCLSVCLCPVLSVMLVYCGQTFGWSKMKLGMQVGLGPQFSAHICCSQMAGWIKTPLGMEVCVSPGYFVLDEDPAPLQKKGAQPPSTIFGQCLSWPNGWMDQDMDIALGMEVDLMLRSIALVKS